MVKKYIDTEMLIAELDASCMPIFEKGISGILGDEESIADVIRSQPAADVQEVKHGHWITTKEGTFECSNCNYQFEHEGYKHFFNYCPCCGFRMDGEDGGENGISCTR